MKSTIIKIAAVALASGLWACSDEVKYHTDSSRFEVDGVTAVAGDECINLQWVPQAGKPTPQSYLITWTSASADSSNGSESVDGNVNSYTIAGLINDVVYTVGVQARYPEGLSQMIKGTCQPRTTRIPVSDMKAMAGDKRVFVAWTVPTTDLTYTYELKVLADGTEVKTVQPAAGSSSCLVEGLENGVEYTFVVTCVYGHGKSVEAYASATPGEIDPIAVVPNQPRPNELTKMEYNPAYFVMGDVESVEWSFADGTVLNGASVVYFFPKAGVNTVTVTAHYADGTTESAGMDVTVLPFAWNALDDTGYQKSSSVVFSPDGQQLYTISQNTKIVYGINAITGEKLWQFETEAATYGAGPAVADNGTLLFGTEDGDGTLYALTPNGTTRWTAKLGNSVKAAPAVTSDGIVYALCDGGTLTALDLETGAVKWTAQKSGNAGAVAVDADGTIYMGTSDGVWAYNPAGSLKWKSEKAYKVTARGGNIAIGTDYVYVALDSKNGVAAVNKTDGSAAWQYKTGLGACYHPVVDKEGTVYVCEKSGGLYAVAKDGQLKWKYDAALGYTFSGFALGENGKAYISQYAEPFNLLAFGPNGDAEVVVNIGAQTMSPVTIGPDGRIYYGLNGSLGVYEAEIRLMDSAWPCNGGNWQSTNSLR